MRKLIKSMRNFYLKLRNQKEKANVHTLLLGRMLKLNFYNGVYSAMLYKRTRSLRISQKKIGVILLNSYQLEIPLSVWKDGYSFKNLEGINCNGVQKKIKYWSNWLNKLEQRNGGKFRNSLTKQWEKVQIGRVNNVGKGGLIH